MGLFDKDGTLIAVANCPESYKPQMQEGSGRTQTIRMILIVNSAEALALKIDPSIVLATRQYVDDGVIEVKAYADTLMKAHLNHADPHPQYAPKASPVFTGTPTAPTAKAKQQQHTTGDNGFCAKCGKSTGCRPSAEYPVLHPQRHLYPHTGNTENPREMLGRRRGRCGHVQTKSGFGVRRSRGLCRGATGCSVVFVRKH
ncbi:hypothetical protein SODG_001870 [Sodalis praecaptivus]